MLAVARCGGFRAAALELDLSPSALSHAINGLEAKLGVRLFNRTTRKVSLTEAGASAAPIHPGFATRYREGYRAQLQHFGDILHGRATPSVGYDDGVAALVLAEACQQSVRAGAPVHL